MRPNRNDKGNFEVEGELSANEYDVLVRICNGYDRILSSRQLTDAEQKVREGFLKATHDRLSGSRGLTGNEEEAMLLASLRRKLRIGISTVDQKEIGAPKGTAIVEPKDGKLLTREESYREDRYGYHG